MDNYWKGKYVIITGGTGFIGEALTRRLKDLGAWCESFGSRVYDLLDEDDCRRFFDNGAVDYIFHLATWTRPGDFCLHHSAEQYYINMKLHVNVLNAWHRYLKTAKLVGAGSSCSYPGHLHVLKETDYWNGEPHESLLAYAMTKRSLYSGQISYRQQYGMKSIHPIFATVYGAGDYFDDERSHCASALIRRFCIAKETGANSVVVWGDGTQEREFVYITDQVDGLLLAAEKYEDGLINLGAGKCTKISELAESIARAVGFSGDIIYDASKFVGIKTKVLDSTMAQETIGWRPKVDLDMGVAMAVEWYRQHQLHEDIKK